MEVRSRNIPGSSSRFAVLLLLLHLWAVPQGHAQTDPPNTGPGCPVVGLSTLPGPEQATATLSIRGVLWGNCRFASGAASASTL